MSPSDKGFIRNAIWNDKRLESICYDSILFGHSFLFNSSAEVEKKKDKTMNESDSDCIELDFILFLLYSSHRIWMTNSIADR